MAYLSLSQTFLIFVPKPAVSLQPASPLSPPSQYLVGLQPAIILCSSTAVELHATESRHLTARSGEAHACTYMSFCICCRQIERVLCPPLSLGNSLEEGTGPVSRCVLDWDCFSYLLGVLTYTGLQSGKKGHTYMLHVGYWLMHVTTLLLKTTLAVLILEERPRCK